jgi:hypothetical protein
MSLITIRETDSTHNTHSFHLDLHKSRWTQRGRIEHQDSNHCHAFGNPTSFLLTEGQSCELRRSVWTDVTKQGK